MQGQGWNHSRYCDAVETEITRFAEIVRGADMTAAVATCPGWTIADLITHMGGVHRWAGAMVHGLAQRPYRREDLELDLSLPDRPVDYPDWLAAGSGALLPSLRAVDPDAPMWVWGADHHARFWSRRMLHETTVHRADAELAFGRDPKIAVDVAADGIDEFFVNLPGAAALLVPNLNKLHGDGERMSLVATDIAAKWLITLRPDGLDWRHEDPHEDSHGDGRADSAASLTVRADAADLLLFVWGRRKPGDAHLGITGDNALLAHWTENSAI